MKKLNISSKCLRGLFALVLLFGFGIGDAWAGGGSSNYYASLKITKSGPTGAGSVYVANSNSKPGSDNAGTAVQSAATTSSGGNVTMYWWVDINPGYNVTLSDKVTGGPYSAATASGNVSCKASTSKNGVQAYTATATFVAVTVNSVSPTSIALDPTDASADYPFTVTFATSNLKTIAIDLDKSPETADGKFTITNWALDGANVVATGKFNGGGTYGGASRNNSTTVSLQSKASGSAAKTCTVTANFPALAFVDADVMDVYTTTGDATKTGTAEFNFNYGAEDDFPTTPSFTHTSGDGAFTVTGYTVTPNFSEGTCKVTVNYSFNPNGVAGTTKEELKITSVGGLVASATVTGEAEAEATEDVSVTTAAGVTTNYATWAEGLAAANASAGCTLTLLRNIDLTETYGITSTQGITQTFTLDLNGKILSAATGGSILNPSKSGKTLTIKDSKTGGRIENIAYKNDIIYGINVGAGVTLNIEGGYIYAENTAQYAYGTSTYTDGTPNLQNMQTRAIHMAATSTVNISGGKVHAVATRNARAINQESSKANNTVLNITGGEVLGEAPCYAYGIYAAGKVNISGGSVNALLNDKTVDGNTTYTANAWNDYTLHRYGYAVMMVAVSNATQTSNYFGTLTITGGTINSTNVNKTLNSSSAVQAEHTYGIYLNVSATGAGAGKTGPDGTKVMKACAIGSMENATININHAGSTAYGVMAVGCYNSFDNTTTPFTIKNSTINVNAYASAYGVYATAYVNWSSTLTALTGNGGCTYGNIELTNTTINATTTGAGAYCGWAGCTSGTVANAKATTGSTSTGNGTYYGEYAAAGKITVNNGTYTASAGTSSAYGFGSSDRAKCVRNVNGVFSGRDAATDPQGSLSDNTPTSEAYPELYIHGGDISATTGTSTTAIAIKSGGNTVINGGTFNAYSGAGTAYGLYVTAGKTTANGVTFPASATTKAYGVYVTGGISDWSLFTYYGEVELNNCNASGTARSTTDARGVFVEGNTKVYTQASFDAMKSANNSNYKNYGDYAQVGERAFVGKATINGGTYTATAETTTAYGIVVTSTRVSTNKEAIAYSPLTVKNATITAKTNTGTTAYGVQPGGGGLIENCTITATAGTTTASGVRAIDKTTVIKNSTITAKGTDAVYGLEGYVDVSTAHGNCWHGDFDLTEAGSTKVTAESTGSTKAYTIYLNAKAANVASGTFAGDYATAANATINEGEYIAKTNGGTSGYTIALTGKQTKGDAFAQPEVLINGGKFNGATAEVGTAGVIGHVQMKGGYYVHSTNLATYIPEGYEAFPLPEDRPEYTAGYRYAIEKAGNHGVYVCQIGSTKYKSLEEALQVVGNNQVIYMIANYTMTTPGDYILPSGATLLIPYKTGSGAGATTAIGNSAKTTTSATTPTLFRKLTFGPGVNLICSGTIETSAEQKANGQYGANVGMASGAYGQIHLEEGSHISIENGARLNCWGFITGKGTIEVKNGGKILEGFQMADWCGGTNYNNVFKSASTANYVFPITHYFYQSIECPITYRPGCRAYGSTHVNVTLAGTVGQDDVPLVGTSGSMFIMDDNDVSKETWVMKDYDEETDQCIWTINSGASIGNLTISISGYNMKSASYDLPITTNMSIVLNYGEMAIGQNTVMLPGSKLIVNKQGTAVINGVTVVAYDAEDWTGSSRYFATYSPTWGTSSPRKNIPVADAEMFLHGKVNIKGNGGLYTTPSGANIHSTNEDAGEVIYTTAATGNKTSYYLNQGGTTRPSLTVNPARLKNGDGSYASSASTAAGKTWTYKNDVWDAWSKDGCFLMDAQDKPHAKPAELVELTSKTPDANHLHHDAATGARNFVWDENCYWWEVVTTPTDEGYYQSLNADNNGKYNYYYYDSAAGCWKIKTLTVTWSINGNNTNYTVGYGTKPHWLGATPTKSSTSSDYAWRWDGWTVGSGSEVLGNEELPYVTANTTFTAHFYEKYYQSLVTFKNDDGTVLESKLWNRGSIPSYEGTPTKDATAAQTFEFNGNWSPTITAVGSSAVEYVAQYTATTRQYNVEFVNYDMSVLGTTKVDYNTTPTTATYKAAIAPSDYEPYKPDNNAYSFVFDGWRLNGASSNGFAQVKGDQTYVAQFAETTKKYRITFVDEDGETVLHWTQLEYDAMPSYDGPATSSFNRQTVEWLYEFTGWTPSEFAAVEGPQTYTADYNKTKREYTITWKDGNGGTLKTDQVAYGEIPSYSGATPTKTSTNTENYTFNNTWSPAIVPVEGEAIYTAQFNATERKYRVTWDANGGSCGTEYTDFSYNAAISTLPSATKIGHTFNGWFTSATGGTQITSATKVTADVTYHAHFTINSHPLTWDANGGELSGTYTSGTAIAYGTAIDVPTVSRANYIFNGWHDGTSIVTPASTMPDNALTYTAQWTPAVASVTAGGTTYYATLEDAIDAANETSGAIVTMLQNVTVTSQIELTATMTIDLNGKIITSTIATATTGTFYINASGKTVTICDNGTGGKIYQEVSCSGYLYGIHLTKGSLAIESGTIHIKNTANNRAYGIYTDGSASSITVSGSAVVKAESSTNPYGLYSSAGNSLTMNGGTFIANGAGSRGIYMKGTTNLTNATITVTGSGAYTIFAVSGNMTINSGTYTTSGATTNLCIYHRSNTITVKGGYFSTSNKLYTRGDGYSGTITLQGGYYNNDIELEGKCATNYHVLSNADANYPYKVIEAYTVTFHANGHGTAPESQLVIKNAKVAAPVAPSATGYTFNGWYKEAGCTNAWNFASDVVTAATTLYAKWTAQTYNITYNLNGGSETTNPTSYTIESTAITLNNPTRNGYTFAGWTGSNGDTPQESVSIAHGSTGNKNYTANWTPIHYTISYNLNDGSETTNPTSYTIESSAITLNKPTKEGHTFAGWTGSNGDTPQESVTIASGSTGNKNYTANWITNYTITWKDGSDVIKSEQLPEGSTPSFDYQKPQTAQYTFTLTGWSDGNTVYEPNALPTVNGEATYTAQLQNNLRSYTIQFVNDNGANIVDPATLYYGATPDAPADPVSSNTDSRITKTFIGWWPAIALVERDVTYTAQYRSDIIAIEDAESPSDPIVIEQQTEVVNTIVETTGKLDIQPTATSEPTLTTNNLILKATVGTAGGNTEDAVFGEDAASGEITGTEYINSENTNVYFDLTLNTWARHWHAFGVPWQIGDLKTTKLVEIETKNGVACHTELTLGRDYEIITYNGQTRASQGAGKQCWDYVADGDGTLTPGKAYMIAFVKPIGTIRFTKDPLAEMSSTSNDLSIPYYEGNGNEKDAGWNAIANPKTYHANMNAGVDFCHVHNADTMKSDGFTTVAINDVKFVVGKAVYVQTADAQTTTVAITHAGSTSYNAPRRSEARDNAPQYYAVHILANGKSADRIYIKADEDKEEDIYKKGIDVAKMGVSTVRAQMWIDRYDTKLAVNTMAPVNNAATYPLGILVPQAGEYTISAPAVENGDMLYLTYDGRVIWNLTYAPYAASFEKGTNSHYGLKLVRSNSPTDIDQSAITNDQSQIIKVLIDNKVYILRGEEIYTITGQKAK